MKVLLLLTSIFYFAVSHTQYYTLPNGQIVKMVQPNAYAQNGLNNYNIANIPALPNTQTQQASFIPQAYPHFALTDALDGFVRTNDVTTLPVATTAPPGTQPLFIPQAYPHFPVEDVTNGYVRTNDVTTLPTPVQPPVQPYVQQAAQPSFIPQAYPHFPITTPFNGMSYPNIYSYQAPANTVTGTAPGNFVTGTPTI